MSDRPRRKIQREHLLQKHIRLWVREAVAEDHEFFAFDRSKANSQWSHEFERQRGIRRSTPDTLLVLQLLTCWCEVKRTGQKPTDEQRDMGAKLEALGEVWFWVTSVQEYYAALVGHRVRLHPNAAFLAQVHARHPADA